MASSIITPRARAANNLCRRRWQSRLRAYLAACKRLRQLHAGGKVLDQELCDTYGALCDLLLVPAPDLPALAIKLEQAEANIFGQEPGLAEIFAAFVADARRLIPQSNS